MTVTPFKRVSFKPRASLAAVAATLMALAGCAQQQQINQPRSQPASLSDAQAQARGNRAPSTAASQVQLGFGQNAPRQNAQDPATQSEQADKAAIAAQARPVREAKTFLGTLPCLMGGACDASRVTLTLAPNGQWRARSQPLTNGGAASTSAQQGCWDVIGVEPWRIRLRLSGSESSTASLTFVNDNMLRVNSVNDHQPVLDYHLTRQADIDGIVELNSAKAPACE
ncbi:hypothetical protein [Pusillimonas noertemannii]|uniref:NlpE-like protein n=1 Tax=Pusillimonas noertemannii TaxID=305977 RepID=A0A2U1CNB1_9BURK|nr:hypothetical protein [Pusillimonas noertemannii]NYT68559.1 hypothetical protein [Pusillimonas noertemannii]PVY62424.1 hypothetical protein C7440_1918 [Pusillimonas noertemannii]TFL10613.1 hypothetical protein CSC72_08790 [Pusillimonas noertemannii]